MTIVRAPLLPGQESVWDYPRPPRLELSPKLVRIEFGGVTIAETRRAFRVLETSHPPTWYIPPEDLAPQYLTQTDAHSFCEWKGEASYYTVRAGGRVAENVAWFYPRPTAAFAGIAHYAAFYPSRMDACFVDGEQVRAQAGDFYGGWITNNIAGPFKGEPETRGW